MISSKFIISEKTRPKVRSQAHLASKSFEKSFDKSFEKSFGESKLTELRASRLKSGKEKHTVCH